VGLKRAGDTRIFTFLFLNLSSFSIFNFRAKKNS
jgi:hypothetical protein